MEEPTPQTEEPKQKQKQQHKYYNANRAQKAGGNTAYGQHPVRLQFSIRSVVAAVKGKSQPSNSPEQAEKKSGKVLSVRVSETW
ncbi:hypothetical protein M5D96_012284 [Drosophila gunungcola]|uniref:Uncharacterized protein n=1 Tax=Drosophila gunungcola TaxID=103775 RepID=A0A9Q0BJM3_9MUSC|nr:hypothetical protein M5D96_012284 [Drosophila gunungcola]